MKGIGWPLLLTATICPRRIPHLAIVDSSTRFRQYAYALAWWCRAGQPSPIVLVENSFATDYTARLKTVAEIEGCELELLTFRGSDRTTYLGKAFGDGECIDHALSYSKTLSAAGGFYKCTGRTAVTNLADFERANFGRKNVFAILGRKPSGAMQLNTVFFRCETAWFDHHLRHEYQKCDESRDITLEEVYFHAIHEVLTQVSPVAPRIMGRIGTLGIPYSGGDFPQDFRDEIDAHLDLPRAAPRPSIPSDEPDRYCGRYVATGELSVSSLEIVVRSEQGRLLATAYGPHFQWTGQSELIWESNDSFHILEFGESRIHFTMSEDGATSAEIAIGTSMRFRVVRVE